MPDLFDFKAKSSAFAVMGNPVVHSKSPEIHGLFAQQCGVTLNYDSIQVDQGGFDPAVSHFFANGGAGLNITVPYKVEAWQLCQTLPNSTSSRAQKAEAVNTLKINHDQSLFGDNTDGYGLVADLQNNIDFEIQDKSILVIGAGGAVRGVLGPLLDCMPESISVANRTVDKAKALAQTFDDKVKAVALDRIEPQGVDLIINGTAASLDGNLPDITSACIGPNTVVYDMMYGIQPTVFMQWALATGACQAHDGLGMLVEQAAESFFIWHQQRPDSQSVIRALRKA